MSQFALSPACLWVPGGGRPRFVCVKLSAAIFQLNKTFPHLIHPSSLPSSLPSLDLPTPPHLPHLHLSSSALSAGKLIASLSVLQQGLEVVSQCRIAPPHTEPRVPGRFLHAGCRRSHHSGKFANTPPSFPPFPPHSTLPPEVITSTLFIFWGGDLNLDPHISHSLFF